MVVNVGYCVKHNEHAWYVNGMGSEGMFPKNFFIIRSLKIELRAFQQSHSQACHISYIIN